MRQKSFSVTLLKENLNMERGDPMFDGIKKKAKLFFRSGDGEFVEMPDLSSLEVDSADMPEAEYIRPPNAEGMSITVDIPQRTASALSRAFHAECFGRLPYRKDGCNHCNMVNDCIKAKIANNFNRR